MTRLFGVEVRRLLSRRLVRVMTGLVVLGCVVAGIVVVFTTESPAESAGVVQSQNSAFLRDCIDFFSSPEGSQELPPGQTPQQFCATQVQQMDVATGFRYVDLEDVFVGTSALVAIVGMLFGASAIGAEWISGNMATLLTWEPRRIRVLAIKATSAAVVAFVVTLALQAFLALVILPAGMINDLMDGVDGEWFASASGVVLRSSLGASILAVLGAALASLGRNTAAALGAGFAYFAIIENLLRAWKPHWASWFFADNYGLLIVGEEELSILGHGAVQAGLLLAAYAGIALAVAIAFFHRRDIS